MLNNIPARRLLALSFARRWGAFGVLTAICLSLLIVLPALAVGGITVNSPADSVAVDGLCTLREALTNANADSDTTGGDCPPGSGDDVIDFAVALQGQTITLGGTELVISSNMTITGPGPDQLAISGGNASRVFSVTTGIVSLSGLTIRDGRVTDANGGGLANNGTLSLSHVSVQSNTIISAGGTDPTDGGGIYNRGILTVTHSAIISNSNLGTNGRGGGVANVAGTTTIINSTVSENRATGSGGGIFNTEFGLPGVLTSTQNTIAHNIVQSYPGGGGIYNAGQAYFKNSLIANNTDNGGNNDCYLLLEALTPVSSEGYNLVEKVGNCTFSTSGDITGQDPKLDPLADYGGPTLSHALQAAGPANEKIPAGVNGCGNPLTTDQRDYLRLSDRACSIGAVEYNGVWLTLDHTVDDDTPDPAQIITFTVTAPLAPSGNVSVTNVLVTDTLSTGLNFVGPISLEGGIGGVAGSFPTLAHSVTITGSNAVILTFPVTVSIGLKGGTVLTAVATVSSAEVTAPVYASQAITVSNVPPVGAGDTASAIKNSGTISVSVTANDYDFNGDVFTLTHVSQPDNGGVAAIAGQKINYAPAADFIGTETFTYTISDAELTATGVVTVTVSDTPPVFLPLIIKQTITPSTVTLK